MCLVPTQQDAAGGPTRPASWGASARSRTIAALATTTTMTMARKKNEMDLAAERQCGLQMVDLLDTPAAWLPVIDENPLLPGFDPKTIVGWTIVMRFPMYTEDDDDAVPSSFK